MLSILIFGYNCFNESFSEYINEGLTFLLLSFSRGLTIFHNINNTQQLYRRLQDLLISLNSPNTVLTVQQTVLFAYAELVGYTADPQTKDISLYQDRRQGGGWAKPPGILRSPSGNSGSQELSVA